jgi:restriction system protein
VTRSRHPFRKRKKTLEKFPAGINGRHSYRAGRDSALFSIWLRSQKPSLLLQAVVEAGERTAEGSIIVAVQPVWDEIVRKIMDDPDFVYAMDPRRWEEMIAASYKRHGFDVVILTPRSGDHGRDIIAVKHGHWSVRVIESVKGYTTGHLVTAHSAASWPATSQRARESSVRPQTLPPDCETIRLFDRFCPIGWNS